jgi:hypothetical protein
MCLAAITCTRQTPGNPSSDQAQQSSSESTPPKPTPAPTAAEEANPATQAPPVAEKPAAKPAPAPLVVPTGTTISIRTTDAISAKTSQAGQTFQAVVAQPVVSQGRTVIPSGSSVTGTIVQAKQGGKIKGESNLALQLSSILVHGVSYPISTGQYVQQIKGKGSRTAKLGAGGGAAGAVIGGLAGGGKGAAIGGLVGGATGVAGSAMTGNKELEIPAESVLQFKLAQPLRLTSSAPSSATEPEQ